MNADRKRVADRRAAQERLEIVEGSGFWVSAIRGFITGISVLAPRDLNLRMHKHPAELIPWFIDEHARLTGTNLDPQELLQQIDHARTYEPSSY